MRILLVGDYPPDARLGSTKVLVKLQEEYRAAGHVCDLLLGDDLGAWPEHRAGRWALAPVAAAAAVRRAIRRNGAYDVIDVASAEGLWLAAWRRLGGLPRTAVVSRSNGLEHLNYRRMLADADAGLVTKGWSRRWYYPLVRLSQVSAAIRLADRAILLNDDDRARVVSRRWKDAAAIDVVPHGVSSRFLEPPPGDAPPRGRGILFCGSWDLVKGVPYLVDAFARLVRDDVRVAPGGSAVALTILGGGVAADAIRLSFPGDVRDRVTVLDRASEDEVVAAYRSHDVLAFPSTYEGFGMVLVEAMSQRLPVVTTPVGCATALVENGRSGLVVQPRDAAGLARALATALGDAAMRDALAGEAFRRVRDMSWSNTARATLDVYRRATAAGQLVHA
ncbi:MAG TPA: glycosyltransferase family 4 protein [Vicinamibacterales bacterium]|nr:glycosyltransferase family 4 protein [Vicinamibacterales bacterium]